VGGGGGGRGGAWKKRVIVKEDAGSVLNYRTGIPACMAILKS